MDVHDLDALRGISRGVRSSRRVPLLASAQLVEVLLYDLCPDRVTGNRGLLFDRLLHLEYPRRHGAAPGLLGNLTDSLYIAVRFFHRVLRPLRGLGFGERTGDTRAVTPAGQFKLCHLREGIVNLTLVTEKPLLQVGSIYHRQGIPSPEVGRPASHRPQI